MDEYFNVNQKSDMCENKSNTEEQLHQSNNASSQSSNLETTVNLKVMKKGINIGFLNVKGICGKEMSKFAEINLMLNSQENKKLHVFGICETKLKEHKMSSSFNINGFQTFRRDNTSNGGGGIIVYVRDGLMAKRRADLEESIECL